MTFTAVPASAGVHALGEGPVWDAARERLLWVDITAGAVHEGRLDPGTGQVTPTARHDFGSTVGAVAVAADGTLIVAERHTLTRLDPDGARAELARVLPLDARSRLNDGAVDPAGRFLVGSLAQDGRHGQEVLARLDAGGVTYLDTDLVLSNGLAWIGDRLYSVDTMPGVVWVRDYDAETGRTGPRREAFRITEGLPDGMCADAEGNLWIANWGLGRVECRTPRGELLAVVETGAAHTSCPVFAGPDLDVLVITTATQDLPDPGPGDGRLFTAEVGVRGLPTPYWNPF
ncbi:SMP-30/gluconolactonase/LRE family protein [Actinomadura sp. ATCC 31491]|uniref:SMP-30/gluconolactonase/LRE family protein n=1 Tax=Actinomadura luzonensis TaxID=2805427 RepID=A0ABT0G2B6_9ACTN|nr:SMP-30/gluconolactonase/LRE family protein [Actinomadura luzonensis]MCK2218734.1 SMP-30/gluconolactonase/LRE family protein [Actinomadura luzonensis]